MPKLEIIAQVSARSSNEVYAVLCNFESYPEISEAVRSVNLSMLTEEQGFSTWEVDFRGGILQWTEEDYFNPEACLISFKQTQGDVENLSGEWRVQKQEEGCLIMFTASFDMGIPSLNHILNPIALQAMRDNIVSIIKGLFRTEAEILSAQSNSLEIDQSQPIVQRSVERTV